MSTQQPGNSGPSNSSDSMSEAELIAHLTAPVPTESQETEELETEEQEEELEESTEAAETEEEETEESEETDPIELLLSTDPERLKEIARQAGSKGLSRFAELTAKNKALEAQLAARQETTEPLPEPLSDNPFRGMDAKQVAAKRDELEKVVESVEALLDEHEDYGPEDMIECGGKQYKKKDLKFALRNSNKSLSKFIPDQLAEIQRIEARGQLGQEFKSKLLTEIPAYADENSELSKQHRALMDSPIIKKLIAAVPEFAPVAEHFVGHAVNSFFSSSKKPKATTAPGTPARPKVSGSPVGAAATATRADAGAKAKEKQAKFMESGRADDLVAALIASQNR